MLINDHCFLYPFTAQGVSNERTTRRIPMIALVVIGAALATRSQAQALVDKRDAQAAALGYVAEFKRADVKRFPKFVAGQRGASFRGNKAALPSKPCLACGLAMSWRRRWANNWADVKYCSETCRRNKTARG